MTPNEYDRLNKAHELRCDIELLTDAIAVLRKQPIRFHGSLAGPSADDGELVRRAVGRFVKDKDIERILSEKLEALEVEFEKL